MFKMDVIAETERAGAERRSTWPPRCAVRDAAGDLPGGRVGRARQRIADLEQFIASKDRRTLIRMASLAGHVGALAVPAPASETWNHATFSASQAVHRDRARQSGCSSVEPALTSLVNDSTDGQTDRSNW